MFVRNNGELQFVGKAVINENLKLLATEILHIANS